ncbi:MAG: response regulator [Pseudomonadota bacterium]
MITMAQHGRILVVDDEPANIWPLIKYLEGEYEILCVTDGDQALEIALSSKKPDLILLDVIMPGMDGYEVCSRLKADETARNIPVIFLTAQKEEIDETKGLTLGAQDYITKPFSMPVVCARIKSILNLKKELDRRLLMKTQLEQLNVQLEYQVKHKVDELKSAQEALRLYEQKYHHLFQERPEGSARKRIMVVDDNPENVHILINNLQTQYEIICADSGESALERTLSDNPPDLILLDIMMPGMDGFEVCSRLKANADTWDIPVIFVSALGLEVDETKGLNLGAVDFITKPFSIPIVDARIKAALRLKEEMDQRILLTRKLEGLNKDLEDRIKEKTAALRQVHEDLKISERKYRSIYENAIEGIFQTTPQGKFIAVSLSFAKILGYESPQELVATITNVAHQIYARLQDRDTFIYVLKQKGEISGFETQFKKKNGDIIWVMISAKEIRDKSGELSYFQGFAIDITQQKRLEGQLRQVQKMESIGTLAGGIAHDFNNILSAITGFTELALSRLPDNPTIEQYLKKVLQSGYRARDLVQRILSFSRTSEQGLKPLSTLPILKEVMKLLRATIPTTIQIYEHWEAQNDRICGNPTQIHQVLMNLCTNASHAMKEKGGTLEVFLNDVNIPTQTTVGHFFLKSGDYLKLTVRDTGKGIPIKEMEKIFDPYFTTKSKGEGTGLGLSIVHGIVKDLGGAVEVSSTVDQGTTFELFFPVTKEGLATKTDDSKPVLKGSGTILLVDDEADLVDAYGELMSSLGYSVQGVTSSRKALEIFRANPEGFDMVFTDHTMPYMTGVQMAVELLKIQPDLPIILYSGYSEDITTEMVKAKGIRYMMAKPLIKNEVAKVLHDCLYGGEERLQPIENKTDVI